MRMGIISILFCSCLLSLVSCEHKDLCYSHPHDQEVRILLIGAIFARRIFRKWLLSSFVMKKQILS